MKSSNSSYALLTVGDAINSVFSGCSVGFYPYDNFPVSYWSEVATISVSSDQYSSYPKVNHYIDENLTQTIEIAATGFSDKEVKVVIKNDEIIVRGKKEKLVEGNTKEGKRKDFIREIAMRDFEESFKINDQYDIDKIDAKLKDGLLRISIPLKEEIKKKNEEKEIKLS
jgi:HSP20 family protein